MIRTRYNTPHDAATAALRPHASCLRSCVPTPDSRASTFNLQPSTKLQLQPSTFIFIFNPQRFIFGPACPPLRVSRCHCCDSECPSLSAIPAERESALQRVRRRVANLKPHGDGISGSASTVPLARSPRPCPCPPRSKDRLVIWSCELCAIGHQPRTMDSTSIRKL